MQVRTMFPFVNPTASFGGNGTNPGQEFGLSNEATLLQSLLNQQQQLQQQQQLHQPSGVDQQRLALLLAQNPLLLQSLASRLGPSQPYPSQKPDPKQEPQQQQQGVPPVLLNSLALFPNALSSFQSANSLLAQQGLQSAPERSSINTGAQGTSSPPETKDVRVKQRLARNRTTARLRRERKKHEAESLTRVVSALDERCKELEAKFNALDAQELERAKKVVQGYGEPDLPCRFCSLTFRKKPDLDDHEKLNHAAEIKAREQFYIESRSFGLSSNSTDGDEHSINGAEDENVKLSRLTSEERKKRRLERNAASARLCRQRKKIYIESLRVQLPGLLHKVKALEAALSKSIVDEIRQKCPIPGEQMTDAGPQLPSLNDILEGNNPALAGTETESNASFSPQQGPQKTPLVTSIPGFGASKRKLQSDKEDSITGVKVPKVDAVQSLDVSANCTNGAETLPPLSGWSKSMRGMKADDGSDVTAEGKGSLNAFTSPLSSIPSLTMGNGLLLQGMLGSPGISPLLQNVYPFELSMPSRDFKLDQGKRSSPETASNADVAGALALAKIRGLAPSK